MQKFVVSFYRLSLVIEFEFGKSKSFFSGGIHQAFGFQQASYKSKLLGSGQEQKIFTEGT